MVFFPEDSTSLFQPGSEGVRGGSGVGRLVAELRGVRSTLDLALFLLTCKQLTQEVIRWVRWRQMSGEGDPRCQERGVRVRMVTDCSNLRVAGSQVRCMAE